MPKISFIILTYNSSRHIEKLFTSLFNALGQRINKGEIEIVVVDNASQDDTLEKVKKFGKDRVVLVKNSENAGFAKGINIGARKAKADNLVFLNPDAEYKGGDIDEVVSRLNGDDVGVIGGAIQTKNGNYEKSAGRFIKTFEVLLMLMGADEALGVRKSPMKLSQVDFVSGGFMFVKKKLFEEMGGFDEGFFMYIEDMELCFRMKKKGFKVIYDPSVVIVHEGQGSSSRAFAYENIFKGLVLFQKKHGNAFSVSMVKSLLVAKAAILVVLGKMLNNKTLTGNYSGALKASVK